MELCTTGKIEYTHRALLFVYHIDICKYKYKKQQIIFKTISNLRYNLDQISIFLVNKAQEDRVYMIYTVKQQVIGNTETIWDYSCQLAIENNSPLC